MALYKIVVTKTLYLNRMKYQEGMTISFEVQQVKYKGKLVHINESDGTIDVDLTEPSCGLKRIDLYDIDSANHVWYD